MWERETTGIYITTIDSSLWQQDSLHTGFKNKVHTNKVHKNKKMEDIKERRLKRTERSQNGRDI